MLNDYIPTTVCSTHQRFAPCRTNAPTCHYTSDPAKVEAVRKFQSNEEEDNG